jgi:hypothetical protein
MQNKKLRVEKIKANKGLPFFHVSVKRMENWLPLPNNPGKKKTPSKISSNLGERFSFEHLWFCCVWFFGLAGFQMHFPCGFLAG